MADEIDAAQAREELDRDLAIRAVTERPRAIGAPECDCGEPIAPYRQAFGAVRCLTCQHSFEAQERVRFGR
jgi:RNA polymerase-binding transcription factor DksA